MCPVDLGKYNNSWYSPGRSRLVQALWFFTGAPITRCSWISSSALRVSLLRLFGARIGSNVVVKPGVQVKYPWFLHVGSNTWIGERAWLDNLTDVRIGSNVCISQGAYFCTGNHDWSDPAFGLIVKPITVGDGAWVGANAVLCPGVELAHCAVAAAGSVVTGNLNANTIYAGNPAVKIKDRKFRTGSTDSSNC